MVSARRKTIRRKPTRRTSVRHAVSAGQNPIFSAVFLVLVFVIAAGIALNVGLPAVDHATAASKFDDALAVTKLVDNAVREVIMEGAGAKRLIKFPSPGEFEVIPQEDAIQFKMQGTQLIEYLSRKVSGDAIQSAGGDVSCSDTGNLTMENSYIKAEFRNVPSASPASAVFTNETLLSIKEKASATTISIVNSSIIVDGDPATSSGTGYSEILRKGKDLPSCTVHVFVNSSADYDVFYTLHAGADFIVADVRNVK